MMVLADTKPDDQTETIAFLMSPEAYGGETESVIRIDTHCAVVFLSSDRAYKMKRSVKLPYLDYSTLPKRREFCEREMMINRLIIWPPHINFPCRC
jgi:aminoglycoside phosphotransferase family enzyme